MSALGSVEFSIYYCYYFDVVKFSGEVLERLLAVCLLLKLQSILLEIGFFIGYKRFSFITL